MNQYFFVTYRNLVRNVLLQYVYFMWQKKCLSNLLKAFMALKKQKTVIILVSLLLSSLWSAEFKHLVFFLLVNH